jgi:hypothetical protein
LTTGLLETGSLLHIDYEMRSLAHMTTMLGSNLLEEDEYKLLKNGFILIIYHEVRNLINIRCPPIVLASPKQIKTEKIHKTVPKVYMLVDEHRGHDNTSIWSSPPPKYND